MGSTPNKRYSLSDFDKRVLDGLKHPVKVMAFVRTEDVPTSSSRTCSARYRRTRRWLATRSST